MGMGDAEGYLSLPYVSPSVADAFQKERNILIAEDVTPDLALRVMLLLKAMESDDATRPIKLIIGSKGGDVQAGWSIIDSMRLCKCPIHTVCFGEAASIAAVIFSSGSRGHRSMLRHSRLMIHQPWSMLGAWAVKESDLSAASDELSKTRDEIEAELSRNSNLSVSDVHRMSERDCWITSDEAVRAGFADTVL